MGMFCYQCQETAKGTGCTIRGVCGKTDDVAKMQDLLIYVLKGISVYGVKARKADNIDDETDKFIMESLFSTITNVNFDKEYFIDRIKQGLAIRDKMRETLAKNGIKLDADLPDAALWIPNTPEELEEKADAVGVLATENEDIRSLRQLITYGVKGMAAYAKHAYVLGYENKEIMGFMQKALAATLDDTLGVQELVDLTMETGKYGVDVMALLDQANTATYGHPEITKVDIGVRNNPGILISGHDLKDLDELLQQTEGTGVDVYTHGEMLPAQYYPAFKKYAHFAGNYGNAWWKQDKEFESFNGPILMTTNCLIPPKDSYKDRVYTTSVVGFPGLKHIPDGENGKGKDFSQIIEHAKKCDPPKEIEKGEIVGGFAHHTVLSLADKCKKGTLTGSWYYCLLTRFFPWFLTRWCF
jgi:hydroxylamine reductase